MKKNISFLFFLIIFGLSFFVNTTLSFAAYEYRNPEGNEITKICGYSDLLSCSAAIQEICPNTLASCVLATDQNCYLASGVEPICPPVQPIAPGNNAEGSDVYTLLAPIGDFKEAPDNIGDYFNKIFLIAIGLCGALAVIMIVIGGVQYMGDESIFGKTEAKSRITKAILGLVIALAAYALLNTVNPDLLGKSGVNIKQVSAEIIDLPDAGDGTVDPDFKKGGGTYSTDAAVSPEVTNVVSKIKQGWEINQFKVYTNNRMLISIKKGTEIDNTNIINIKPGINGYALTGTARTGDKKTPIGSWKIISIKTSKDGQPVYNKSGANMGASFWLLSPMTSGERGIGMHGNKNGTLSGTFGCIRLKNADLLALLPYVKPGILVNVVN